MVFIYCAYCLFPTDPFFTEHIMRNVRKRPFFNMLTANVQISVQSDLNILCSSTYTIVSIHSVRGPRKPRFERNEGLDQGLRCPQLA